MADIAKNPARCSSAKFGTDTNDGAFALLSCAAWLSLNHVNHQAIGIRRRDTYVFPPIGNTEEKMIEEIGAKSCEMCTNCDRFSPKSPIERPLGGNFSDPEYSPDPVVWPVGVPRN